MINVVNGLAVTKVRKKLVAAIAAGRGRVYYDPSVKKAWDNATGHVVTARIEEMVRAGWIVASPIGDRREPGELAFLVYYRLTDAGRTAMGGNR